MDLQFPYFQILFAFSLFVIIKRSLVKRGKAKDSCLNLPPGPWKLPFIGNIHQIAGGLPHRRLRYLAKKHGSLMHLKLGEISIAVVSSPEFAKEVMKTHDATFASRPYVLVGDIISYGSTNIAFAKYGDYWRQLRKICTQELLSATCVRSLRPLREEEALIMIKGIASEAGSPINLTEQIYSSAYAITSRAAIGKKYKDHGSWTDITKEVLKLAAGFSLADAFPSFSLLHRMGGTRPKLERLHKEADRHMENIINEHRDKSTTKIGDMREEREDLVDVLLKYHKDNGGLEFSLTTDNIKAVISDILSGGSEAPAITLDWAMAELVKNPRIMKKARHEVREVFDRKMEVSEAGIAEMKYLHLVIKETLRLHPPAPLLAPRECGEKCEIGGYEIPVNTKVVVNGWAIGRDPKYWTDPESFYPERFLDNTVEFLGNDFEYIPFGAGRRMCPGMTYGLANVELILAFLLYHFDWELPNGIKHEDFDMTEAFGMTAIRKEELCLIPIPYRPSTTPGSN